MANMLEVSATPVCTHIPFLAVAFVSYQAFSAPLCSCTYLYFHVRAPCLCLTLSLYHADLGTLLLAWFDSLPSP